MSEINDSVFGQLRYNYVWNGEVFIPFLNKVAEISINGNLQHPPNEADRNAFSNFLSIQNKLKPAIESATYNYYLENFDLFRGRYDENVEQFVPTLQQSSDIWKLLEFLSISVSFSSIDEDVSTIRLHFSPIWDEEHGLDVEIFDSQIGIGSGGDDWLSMYHYPINNT